MLGDQRSKTELFHKAVKFRNIRYREKSGKVHLCSLCQNRRSTDRASVVMRVSVRMGMNFPGWMPVTMGVNQVGPAQQRAIAQQFRSGALKMLALIIDRAGDVFHDESEPRRPWREQISSFRW